MSEPFLGEIRMFGFNFAPTGWAMCNGQILSIQQNAALFALLGTFYGGNGTSTFALPNLQGRRAIHQGQLQGGSVYTIGEFSGNENATLLSSNMPSHSHTVNCFDSTAGTTSPQGALLAKGGSYAASSPSGTMSNSMIAMSGNSIPFSILDPYLCVNFCIALVGIFPSRN